METTMKTCRTCLVEKKNNDFYPSKTNLDKLASICKGCNKTLATQWRKNNREKFLAAKRKNNIKRLYGMSIEEYNRMLVEQKGECKICRSKTPRTICSKRTFNFVIDHDHVTGKVRGLLCYSCNFLLGRAKDNIEILNSMILYLSVSNITREVLSKAEVA